MKFYDRNTRIVVSTTTRHTGHVRAPPPTPTYVVQHASQSVCPHGTSAVSRERSRQHGHSLAAAGRRGESGLSGAVTGRRDAPGSREAAAPRGSGAASRRAPVAASRRLSDATDVTAPRRASREQ